MTEPSKLTSVVIAVALSVMCAFAVVNVQLAWEQSALAVGLLVTVFLILGIGVCRYAYRLEGGLSLIQLVTVFYLVAFGLGSIYYFTPGAAIGSGNLGGLKNSYSTEGIVTALGLALLGWACFAVGYLISNWTRIFSRIPRASTSPSTSGRYVIWALVIGLPARLGVLATGEYFHYSESGPADPSIYSNVLRVAANLPLIAIVLLGIARFSGDRRLGRFFFPLLALEFIWTVPTGERESLLSLALAVVIARYFASTKRFPWGMLAAVGFVSIVLIFPFGAYYRGAGGASGYQSDPVAQMNRAASQMLTKSPLATLEAGATETLSRFSDAATLATITSQGRERFPTKGRDKLTSWAYAIVPRALLPTKSDPGDFGNQFGRAYGILWYRDTGSASVAVTQVGDFYGSFGLLGVILGLAIAGVLYRSIAEYLADMRENALSLAIYATIAGPMIFRLETSFAVGFFQTAKELVFYSVFLAAVAWFSGARLVTASRASPLAARDSAGAAKSVGSELGHRGAGAAS